MEFFDGLNSTNWKRNCEQAENYFTFLEDELVNKNDTLLVTYTRLNHIIPCKTDCNFDRLLSVPSNFSADNTSLTHFATNALTHLSANVSCKFSQISQYIAAPKTAADLITNISNNYHLTMYKCYTLETNSLIMNRSRSNHVARSN